MGGLEEITKKTETQYHKKKSFMDFLSIAKNIGELTFYLGIIAGGAYFGHKILPDEGILDGALFGGVLASIIQDIRNGEFDDYDGPIGY